MIKTVFVPLVSKGVPGIPTLQDRAQIRLQKAMSDALVELDMALDENWRIIAQQYIESGYDAGTVFFLRDDDEDFFDVTEEGLELLTEEVTDTKEMPPVLVELQPYEPPRVSSHS